MFYDRKGSNVKFKGSKNYIVTSYLLVYVTLKTLLNEQHLFYYVRVIICISMKNNYFYTKNVRRNRKKSM